MVFIKVGLHFFTGIANDRPFSNLGVCKSQRSHEIIWPAAYASGGGGKRLFIIWFQIDTSIPGAFFQKLGHNYIMSSGPNGIFLP